MKNFLSRFNFRKWTFDGKELNNPAIIVWRLLTIIPYTLALLLFCFVAAIATLSLDEPIRIYKGYGGGF